MKTTLKRILYSSLILAGLVSASAVYQSNVHAQNTATPTVTKVNYAKKTPVKTRTPALNLEIRHLAHQRKQYYHPSISWNFRDIGGYNTANNRYHVKTGKLFISSYLPKNISWRGAHRLKQLHVHTDIDMRNYKWSPTSIVRHKQPGELGAPDYHHLHLKYLRYPVETSGMERKDWKKVPNHRQNDLYYETRRFRYQYDRTPIARWTFQHSFYAIMKYTKGNNAIMFNCNSGRDRSACLAAIILGTLGVNQHTIKENYLLTNHYYYQTSYYNQRNRINTLLATIHKHYGSFYNYDRKGLHLSRHFIKQFQNRFLVRN